jgi:hypothetical protein
LNAGQAILAPPPPAENRRIIVLIASMILAGSLFSFSPLLGKG